MRLRNYPDSQLISTQDVLFRIKEALKKKKPFSLVRVGDAENIIMAQDVFFTSHELLELKWLNDPQYTSGERGVSLPNIEQRDATIKAVKIADMVGICRKRNDKLIAEERLKRPLTNEIFDHYNITPPALCQVFVNREMVSKRMFWELLHNYRTLLISRWAPLYWKVIVQDYPGIRPKIVGYVDITTYAQIPQVLETVRSLDYDLALISAGTSATILATEIAQRYDKVAIDFGHVMAFTLTNDPRVQPWYPPESKKSSKKRPIPSAVRKNLHLEKVNPNPSRKSSNSAQNSGIFSLSGIYSGFSRAIFPRKRRIRLQSPHQSHPFRRTRYH